LNVTLTLAQGRKTRGRRGGGGHGIKPAHFVLASSAQGRLVAIDVSPRGPSFGTPMRAQTRSTRNRAQLYHGGPRARTASRRREGKSGRWRGERLVVAVPRANLVEGTASWNSSYI
jgi:hypothetical protein